MSRPLIRLLLVLATLMLPVQRATAADVAAGVTDSDVRVQRSGGGFTVDVVFHAPVPPAQAWAVFTDFDHMADFVPNLATSQVVERADRLLKVRQTGVARYGIFSTAFESVREIRLDPPREVRAHAIGGNIKGMESVMQLEAEGTGTRLRYHAEVLPGFWLPPLIGPALVRHETAEQFSAILQEMLRRR